MQAHLFSPSKTELQNKVILITGAGDGIGRQAALSFAEHGAEVILLGKTVKKLEAVYDEIVAAGYIEPGIIPLDMQGATEKHYTDMGAMLIDQYGRLDGILHNASILGHLCPFNQITSTEFNDVMQVNVTAQFLMTQGILPALQMSEHGSIIFTTSSVGREGRAFWGTYSISKFATEGMMQVMASEYTNSHIRVNCINPGAVRTKMREAAYPAEDPNKNPTAESIMMPYLYLMSDMSLDISGHSIDAQES